jgi:hypothetical protein
MKGINFMKNNILSTLFLSASITLFTGCGSNSKSDGGSGAAGTTTGLSISYMSTQYQEEKGFIDHYRVHAADSNGKAVSGLSLDMSIINGVKKIRNRKLQLQSGGIESSTPIVFFDSNVNFTQTNIIAGDNLIVIPSSGRTNSSYLGDWNIQSVGAQLALSGGSFNLENTDDLTYIVGNEERFLGSSRGRIAIAHIEEVKRVTNADGFSYFDVVYDTALGGHTVTLGVHTSGNRLSGAKVAGLRGGTYTGDTITLPIDGYSHTVYMSLGVSAGNGGGEHLIDVDIVPSSFVVSPEASCRLNRGLSNLHTSAGGYVKLVIDTIGALDSNSTTTSTTAASLCTVSWTGSNTSIYLEY